MKNLFLEGESGAGKSSLILAELGELTERMAGFGVLRLRLSETSETVGYRVVPAAELSRPDEYYDACDDNRIREAEGLFIRSVEPRWKSTEVFTQYASRYLDEPADASAVLMDEFGGVELLNEGFTQKLKKTLEDKRPVIGVLKSRKNAERAARNLSLPQVYHDAYQGLREYIENRSDSVILNVDLIDEAEIISAIREWKHTFY